LQQELTVLPIAEAADAAFRRWQVDARRARLLLNGVRLEMPGEYAGAGPVAVFDAEGRFLALVEEQRGKAKSLAVFG
ncbi:tRNA pseudouridine(55) synthase TruB, partial [Streptomyces broussonetiae]